MANLSNWDPEMHNLIGYRRYMPYVENGKTWLVGGAGVITKELKTQAVCLVGGDLRDHILNGALCHCGHGISKDKSNPHNGGGPIYATCLGWGAYVEGSLGWRTEWMEITELAVFTGNEKYDTDLAKELEKTYGITVSVLKGV